MGCSRDLLKIGGRELKSRLITGTGKHSRDDLIPEILRASRAEVITVALRRMDWNRPEENITDHIPGDMILMPNTSGARTAAEAVRLAELARAAGCGNWVKVEVISDNTYLLPDGYETVKATEMLAERGFEVFPYMNPDLYVARSLRDAGAAAVMPLGSPIGSYKGLRTEEMIRILIQEIDLPIIVDAGIGRPSEACRAMELGADACMINSAIALADDPVAMAEAFAAAIEAGRKAFLSGYQVPAGEGLAPAPASASSPLTDFLFSGEPS
ncbi:MAG: thiazole synthase [Spirochaetales bacterium]|nr:thiazole synthase [Spirochaetales bacterium]